MKLQHATHQSLRRVLALSGIAALFVASPWLGAQTGMAPQTPPVASPGASAAPAPLAGRPTPRVTSPSDAQRSLDLNNPQPEGKVAPQIRIPLGKKGDTPIFQRRRPDPVAAGSQGNLIDDAAARCESQRDAAVRAKCRDPSTRIAP